MKRHRYKVSFFLTALLYLFAAWVYVDTFKTIIAISDKPDESKIDLSLSQFVPKALPTNVAAPIQPEQPVKQEPERKEKPKPKSPKPKTPPKKPTPPKPEPVPMPKPIVKPIPKPVVKKTAVKKTKQHKRVKKKTHSVHQKRRVSGGGTPHRSAARKNEFLAQIRAKINKAKSYPRVAKRRGMQGTVKARFTILKNGSVGNIVLSGSSLFYSSARKAIQSAFPVDANKAPMQLPCTVSLTLRYRLR